MTQSSHQTTETHHTLGVHRTHISFAHYLLTFSRIEPLNHVTMSAQGDLDDVEVVVARAPYALVWVDPRVR